MENALKKRYGLAFQSDVNSKAVFVLMIKVKKLGFRNRKFYQVVHDDCQLFLSYCSFFNCLVCLKKMDYVGRHSLFLLYLSWKKAVVLTSRHNCLQASTRRHWMDNGRISKHHQPSQGNSLSVCTCCTNCLPL